MSADFKNYNLVVFFDKIKSINQIKFISKGHIECNKITPLHKLKLKKIFCRVHEKILPVRTHGRT